MINSQGPSVEHYHHYPCWPPPRATYRETRASSSARRSCISVRSEEHTSELQSLMRTSYAVFCLKKKLETKKVELTCDLPASLLIHAISNDSNTKAHRAMINTRQ